jgi:phage baseplate assembly protein V
MSGETRRLLHSITNKIFLLLGRGIVKAMTSNTGTQGVQVVALSGETISDIERMEEYGFTAVPEVDSEAAIGFLNGNRDQGIVICIADRRYRPTGLASGEVSVYDKNGSKVLLKADGSIEIESKAKMTIKSVTGCVVEDAAGVQLKTGDAMTWMPNILKVDPFTGLPHGGPGAGIVLLTGG